MEEVSVHVKRSVPCTVRVGDVVPLADQVLVGTTVPVGVSLCEELQVRVVVRVEDKPLLNVYDTVTDQVSDARREPESDGVTVAVLLGLSVPGLGVSLRLLVNVGVPVKVYVAVMLREGLVLGTKDSVREERVPVRDWVPLSVPSRLPDGESDAVPDLVLALRLKLTLQVCVKELLADKVAMPVHVPDRVGRDLDGVGVALAEGLGESVRLNETVRTSERVTVEAETENEPVLEIVGGLWVEEQEPLQVGAVSVGARVPVSVTVRVKDTVLDHWLVPDGDRVAEDREAERETVVVKDVEQVLVGT